MALVFDEAKHEYQLDGVVLPSVTEICRFLTMDVAEGANKEMRDAAAERGTRIHEACTMYDFEGEDAEIDGDIVGYVEAYAAFKRDYQIDEWLLYEHPMANKELGFAGTLDRYGIIDGSPCILDIKSGSTVNKLVWAAQLFGYWLLLNQDKKVNMDEIRTTGKILKLKKDGKYTIYSDLKDGEIFVTCLTLKKEMGWAGEIK